MAISSVVTAGSGAANAANLTSTVPSGFDVRATDLRLHMMMFSTGRTVATPAGWNLYSQNDVGTVRLTCHWQWTDVANPSTVFTFSGSGTNPMVNRTGYLRGVHTTSPFDLATPIIGSQTSTTSNWSNIPTISPVTAGAWVMWWIVAGTLSAIATRTMTPGGSFGWSTYGTTVYGGTSTEVGYMAQMMREERATPGATGTRAMTSSVATTWRSMQLALRPDPTAGTDTTKHHHTLAHHEPDRPGELWTPPDRQLHRPRRRRRVLDLGALPAAA